MAQIKGFALRGLLKQIKGAGLPGGIPALLQKLPPGEAATFARPIGNGAWYPYAAFAALLRAMEQTMGKGDSAFMASIGYRSGREDSGTVFKVIAAIASAETILKRGAIFWGQYCDTGTFIMENVVTATAATPGAGRAMLKNFPAVDPAHCALITGWIRGIGEAAGAKNVAALQTRCVHRGDPWCEYEAKWTK